MSVPLVEIAGALERAGLLLERLGSLPETVTAITDDSRAVQPGGLFIAVKGSARDGHEFLPGVVASGAAAALVESTDSLGTLPAFRVRDGRRAAAVAARAFYGNPATRLKLIGVTGTNGKTTTVNILRHLLDTPDVPAASLGTLGVLIGSAGRPLEGGQGLTTPGPVELQRVLHGLVNAGVRTVAMEVSSHSLEQRRVEGLEFSVAVFTNFSRDHLDYHRTMEAYFAAKVMLLEQLAPGGHIIVNADDPAWSPLSASTTFGVENPADVQAVAPYHTPRGSEFVLRIWGEDHAVRLPLIGDFNVSNAAGAAAAAWRAGVSATDIGVRMDTTPQVPGRLEIILDKPTVLRDYAHTPDALERALQAVRPFATGKLIVVFGCGGDRDKGKRPEMGRIAEQLADVAIVTSDNPRTEDPERIIDDIEAGMARPHVRIEDRREAIATALEQAGEDDVIVLAGKGHETYQIRGTTTLPFDEREIVTELASGGAAR